MSFTPENRRRLLEAVVSLATKDGLGEELFWETIEPALMELVRNPTADRDLRVLLPRINDTDVIATLDDWFTRAARERARDQRRAATNAGELITPIKRLGYGATIAGLAGAILGTAALPVALPLILLGSILAAGGMASSLTVRRKADAAEHDRELLHRLAEICRKELEARK